MTFEQFKQWIFNRKKELGYGHAKIFIDDDGVYTCHLDNMTIRSNGKSTKAMVYWGQRGGIASNDFTRHQSIFYMEEQ